MKPVIVNNCYCFIARTITEQPTVSMVLVAGLPWLAARQRAVQHLTRSGASSLEVDEGHLFGTFATAQLHANDRAAFFRIGYEVLDYRQDVRPEPERLYVVTAHGVSIVVSTKLGTSGVHYDTEAKALEVIKDCVRLSSDAPNAVAVVVAAPVTAPISCWADEPPAFIPKVAAVTLEQAAQQMDQALAGMLNTLFDASTSKQRGQCINNARKALAEYRAVIATPPGLPTLLNSVAGADAQREAAHAQMCQTVPIGATVHYKDSLSNAEWNGAVVAHALKVLHVQVTDANHIKRWVNAANITKVEVK